MKYIVILVNIVLLILIIYNLFIKPNIVESLDNCPKDKKNRLYKNNLKINNLFSQINTMNSELSNLKQKTKLNYELANNNKKSIKSSVGDIKSAKDAKMKELENM
jgi:hypothetical protein